MPNPHDLYTSPLAARNASPEMLRVWSARHKFSTWRRIWLAIAEAQQACGLDISDAQLAEMRARLDVTDADMDAAAEHERQLRHDVMAHVHAFADAAPAARPIIHLGCTSQDVVCNADLLLLLQAGRLIERKTARAVVALAEFGRRHADLPTLGFTHYQPAQPTTVGRRAVQWAADLDLARGRLEASYRAGAPGAIKLRGLRGATGTQASFLRLFDGDSDRVHELDRRFRERLGADAASAYPWTGQTYPRVVDAFVLADLGAVAAVLHKIATDIRLLSNRKELDEPFGDRQIGSSAMPYKRNPMRCERICGLSRFVVNLVGNAYDTAATQWLERTLDDSSNRRLSLPEAFLALDGALDLMHNVASGLEVHAATVRANLMAELPFMASENLMMEAVTLGRDRQDVHEAIRAHAQAAGLRVKREGKPNDLLDRLRGEPLLQGVDIDRAVDPAAYVGHAPAQVDHFFEAVVDPLRQTRGDELDTLATSEPKV